MAQPDPLSVEIVARFVELVHAWERNASTQVAESRRTLARLGIRVCLPTRSSAREMLDEREMIHIPEGGNMVETITWIPVEQRMPDDDIEVLLCVENRDGSRIVGSAYLEEGEWCWECGSHVQQQPIGWAEMPRGMG